ncbi:MAG: glutathione S-transferase family protein [Tabrizicola sp.]|nr:glutathione S-transferase family protein [Tabrizicola sp.]
MYTLHAVPDWASVIVRLVLEEMDLPHEIVLKDAEAGDLDLPAYRRVNPAGLIPALETPDGPIFETAAILLWLTDRHGALAPPPQSAERAGYLSWLFFTSNSVHNSVMALVHPERQAGDSGHAEASQIARDTLIHRFGLIEAMLQTGAPPWLSTREPGALGYYLGTLARWAKLFAANPADAVTLDAFPALRDVLAAHEARPAALRVARAEGLGPSPFTDPRA